MSKTLALVAVAGLALAGYAGAASTGALPEGMDLGLGARAKCARLAAAATNDPGPAQEACERLRDARGPMGGRGAREGHRPHPAPFQVNGPSVEGTWVSFQVDAANSSLLDYTSRGPWSDAVIFDRVQVLGAGGEAHARACGPVWAAGDGEAGARVFNAPNAFLAVGNRGDAEVTVTFDLADGVVAEQGEKGIVLTRDGHRAGLRGLGNATLALDGGLVTATLPAEGGVAFAIQGFPGALHMEKRALRHGVCPAGDPAPEEA